MQNRTIDVSFPGGKRVTADFGDRQILTDQSPANGGEGAAPEPFDLFLGSLATCAGIFALGFCQKRGISTDGLELRMRTAADAEGRRIDRVDYDLTLPPGFPEKYESAIARAIELCTVKRHLAEPPSFAVHVARAAAAA